MSKSLHQPDPRGHLVVPRPPQLSRQPGTVMLAVEHHDGDDRAWPSTRERDKHLEPCAREKFKGSKVGSTMGVYSNT